MTKTEFDAFVKRIYDKLGNPKMTWDGPKPHDFRNMKERGLRFVHSGLLSKIPDIPEDDAEYAPDGKVLFKIYVGDDRAAADIGAKLTQCGITWERVPVCDVYSAILFDVAVVNSAT